MEAKESLTMPLLTDPDLAVMAAYGVVNESRGNMPHPTVIGIDKAGVVRYIHLDEDYRQRPTPDAVLEAVAAMGSEAESAGSSD